MAAMMYRLKRRVVEVNEETGGKVYYTVVDSEATPGTNGRKYSMSAATFYADYAEVVSEQPEPEPEPEPEPPSKVEPLYATDFESDDLNANGFRWASENERVRVTSDHACSGSRSMRFRFGPDRIGQDSWAERRFSFPRTPELWLEFMLWIPANYTHREDAPDNNKLFAIWGGGGDAYASAGRAKAVIELWRITGGDSRFRFMYNPRGDKTSHTLDNVTPAISASGPLRRGQWNRFRYHVAVGEPGKGVIEAWVGDRQVYSNTAVDLYPSPANAPYFDSGYLLGWSNSGFTEQTDFFIDDFKLYAQNPGW